MPETDEIRAVLIETYAVNDAMNQLLLKHLDPRAWRAQLPTVKKNNGRTIAAIFAHLHNSRLVAQAQCPAFEFPCPAGPMALHDEAGCERAAEECRALPADARRPQIDLSADRALDSSSVAAGTEVNGTLTMALARRFPKT